VSRESPAAKSTKEIRLFNIIVVNLRSISRDASRSPQRADGQRHLSGGARYYSLFLDAENFN
jgi:hypothetical protein